MAKLRIFVSYSSLDYEFADKLKSDLDAAGAQTWLYGNNRGSFDFNAMIDEVLANCDWFLQVLTPNALASQWVHIEVDEAITRKLRGRIKGLLFIEAKSIDYTDFPTKWRGFSILDGSTESSYHTALQRVLKEVQLRPVDSHWQGSLHPLVPGTKASQQIFISYRRDDSAAGHAGRLRADLVRRYGDSNVFMDLAIEPGVDFVDTLENAVGSCAVLLAVIGRNWLTVTDAKTGKRRLDNPMDWVRVEVATALRRNIRVIPVLFHGAHMPSSDDLPDNLKPLARRNALEITDSRWDYDVGKLLAVLDKIVGDAT